MNNVVVHNFLLGSSTRSQFFFHLGFSFFLSIMELSHMIFELIFLHFVEIIGGLFKNSEKAYWSFDKGIDVSILSETRTSIIEMIRPSWTQHLNKVMVINIVTTIITR
ncbi:hypothetical protein AAZX31_19G050800 [Glycine max]